MAFSDKDLDVLLYGIKKGKCILFLGPDLPRVLDGGIRSSPAADLARRLIDELKPDGDGDGGRELDPDNLAQIAQRFLIEQNELALEMQLAQWHESLSGQRSELHDNLAALPFRHIVTSAHDPLMETALRAAGKSPDVERYHYKGRNYERADPTESAPLLFHLYGAVSESDSVVLSETQLLDFLAKLIAKDPPLPRYVDATLTTGSLFLFLGFGLRHWYLRILLHVLKVLREGCTSFAIEALSVENAKPSEDTILFYQDNFKVGIEQQDVVQFAETLRGKYVPPPAPAEAAAGGAPEVASAGPGSNAPTVFICHASENQDVARQIHDALERSGLQAWLDKEDLSGGLPWDEVIESTIRDASFFVLLNSHELLAKTRDAQGAYVNREIKAALDGTRNRFTNFIFPVLIDDAPLFEPLEDFQAVDLRSRGVRELVRAIKREAEKAP